MKPAPSTDDLKATLATLDARQRKIVSGMLALMIKHPGRVHEREWVTESFTLVTSLSLDSDVDPDQAAQAPQAAVADVQRYVQEHASPLLNASFALFRQVGDDMAGHADAFTFEDAMKQVMAYLL